MKLSEYPSVKKWLNRLSTGTYPSYLRRLSYFHNWLGENGGEFAHMTPDDLIVYVDGSTKKELNKLLDKVQEYISSLKGLRLHTLKGRYTAIRSFFAHNRAALPKDPNFIIRADNPPVEGTLTAENIRDVARGSKPGYRAIILCSFQSGMGQDEFVYWNLNGWESLQKDVRENKPFITVKLPGRKGKKNEMPYKTFIGGDAKAALLKYLPYREKDIERFHKNRDLNRRRGRRRAKNRGEPYIEKEFNPNAIFYSNKGKPIGIYALYEHWERTLIKLDIRKPKGDGDPRNRYGDNYHEMRDVFRSQWQKTKADKSVAEYMMGHTEDRLGYNKAYKDNAWVINEIRKAMHMLNIMSSNLPFGLLTKEKHDAEIYELQERVRIAEEKLSEYENGQKDSGLRTDIDLLKDEFARMKNNLENPV